MIGSVALMLDMSFHMLDESKLVWQAMQSVFRGWLSLRVTCLSASDGTKLLSHQFETK